MRWFLRNGTSHDWWGYDEMTHEAGYFNADGDFTERSSFVPESMPGYGYREHPYGPQGAPVAKHLQVSEGL